jgi:hypothetical protein
MLQLPCTCQSIPVVLVLEENDDAGDSDGTVFSLGLLFRDLVATRGWNFSDVRAVSFPATGLLDAELVDDEDGANPRWKVGPVFLGVAVPSETTINFALVF